MFLIDFSIARVISVLCKIFYDLLKILSLHQKFPQQILSHEAFYLLLMKEGLISKRGKACMVFPYYLYLLDHRIIRKYKS